MKRLEDLLVLGHPLLYEVSEPVLEKELPLVKEWVANLHQVMEEIRAKYHFGRAIAAPGPPHAATLALVKLLPLAAMAFGVHRRSPVDPHRLGLLTASTTGRATKLIGMFRRLSPNGRYRGKCVHAD